MRADPKEHSRRKAALLVWSTNLQFAMACTLAFALMTLMWLIQLRTRNAGIVDVAWGAGIGLLGALLAVTSGGDEKRQMLLAGLVGMWSVRLALYLFVRVIGHPEEGRYATLRQQWGERANLKMFWFFQLQAATVVLFASPVWIAASNEKPWGQLTDYVGVSVWMVGMLGVSLSDWQLARFKRDSQNRGKTCRAGLWRYSRHPNYFFEWLLWWSYTLLAFPGALWWLAPVTPLLLLYFFLYVTGIPPTEAQALASRGDDYRRYQKETSPFVPWFPRKDSSS